MPARRYGRSVALLGTALAAALVAAAAIAFVGPGGRSSPAPRDASPPEGVRVISTRLLPMRVQDPQGGPPWALRLLRTSRGWTCAQVGRVLDGRFGELGVDGAFHDDGRLHAPPPGEIPEERAAGSGPVNDECLEADETFAGELGALDRSAAFGAQERRVAPADLRRISYGLLGRRALAITYRTGRGRRTVPLHAPRGAYLIVQPVDAHHYRPGSGAAPGDDRPGHLLFAGPTGALTAIEYRYGARPCRQTIDDRACSALLPAPTGTR